MKNENLRMDATQPGVQPSVFTRRFIEHFGEKFGTGRIDRVLRRLRDWGAFPKYTERNVTPHDAAFFIVSLAVLPHTENTTYCKALMTSIADAERRDESLVKEIEKMLRSPREAQQVNRIMINLDMGVWCSAAIFREDQDVQLLGFRWSPDSVFKALHLHKEFILDIARIGDFYNAEYAAHEVERLEGYIFADN